MEQRRVILIVIFALIASYLWHDWTLEHLPPPQAVTQSVDTNQLGVQATGSLPAANPASSANTTPQVANANPSQPTAPVQTAASTINIKTDVLNVDINTLGGTVTKAALIQYPLVQGKPEPVVLMNNEPLSRYLAQSFLVSSDNKFSDKNVVYTATQSFYELNKGQKELVVNLTYQSDNGLKIVKIFTFLPGKYNVGVTYQIQNGSSTVWQGNAYGLLTRNNSVEQAAGMFHVSSYTGASVSTQNSPYQKVTFKNMQKQNLNTTSQGGWIAMQQHYFLSAWVPVQQDTNRYFTQIDNDGLYTIGVAGSGITVQPGQTVSNKMELYAGPELADQLKPLAPHLDLTIDYGWLWFISDGIFWLMQKVYNFIGNWGWSIVVVTILIKLAFYHLSATSYRSMAKMRKLQPKLQALKDRYGDDKQKMAQATMELYRQEKANPMTGCLPILIQIPVFIALYWVIVESVQLRQAPFIFWIHDLSSRDPYFILPIINGLAMFVQQKLNPPPPDPTQAKIMMFLPLLFTFIFINFPAGLVLYWVVNSLVSILQQWFITRQVERSSSEVVVIPKNKR
ncbi:MAG: membrane protein insertase YidC [Gammaproteobacteria bacterium]|nr:membrane protein insertase YidC [Gammaproteobacteria bacterium]